MDLNNVELSAYGTELPFRQSVAKIPSERTAQVCLIDRIEVSVDKLEFTLTRYVCLLKRIKVF